MITLDITFDSHIDIPWPEAGDAPAAFGAETTRCADLPKMQRGGLNAACYVAYVPQEAEDAAGRERANKRALAMLNAIRAFGTLPGAECADTAADIVQVAQSGRAAIIAAVENGAALGGSLAQLAAFRALGARYMTLCHNGHNMLCDSSRPSAELGDSLARHDGLSGFGREAIAEMNRLGMLVDISHASDDAMMQASEISATPIVATHSSVKALCDHPRNLTDIQLDRLRDIGGLVQITAVPCFLKPGADIDHVSLADYCDHIDYAVARCGIAHVGIGSDFDGGGGVRDWRSVADTPSLTQALRKRGYKDDALAALWGGNFLRLLRLAEEKAAR